MNDTNVDNSRRHLAEANELLQRMVYLRYRLRSVLPESIGLLKKRIDQAKLEGITEGIDNINQFYNVCLVLNMQPGPLTMGELSRALEIPLSNTTRIVDWFARNEYAVRLQDPEDRRIVRVELTRDGEELYRTINGFLVERIDQLMSHFSSEEAEQLLFLVRKLMDILERDL
jgi:DNA-binding MarR family transcriptional regulator